MAFAAFSLIPIQFALLGALHFLFLTATMKGRLFSLAPLVASLTTVQGAGVPSSLMYVPAEAEADNLLVNAFSDTQNAMHQEVASSVLLPRRHNPYRPVFVLGVAVMATLAVTFVILLCFRKVGSMQLSSLKVRLLAQGGDSCEEDEEDGASSSPSSVPSRTVVLTASNGLQVRIKLKKLYKLAGIPEGYVLKGLPSNTSYTVMRVLEDEGRLVKVDVDGYFFFFIKFRREELQREDEVFDLGGNAEQIREFLDIMATASSHPLSSTDERLPELPPPDYDSHAPPEIIPPPDYPTVGQSTEAKGKSLSSSGPAGIPSGLYGVHAPRTSPPHTPPPSLRSAPMPEAQGPSRRETETRDRGRRESSTDSDSSGEGSPSRGILRGSPRGSKKKRVRFSDEETNE